MTARTMLCLGLVIALGAAPVCAATAANPPTTTAAGAATAAKKPAKSPARAAAPAKKRATPASVGATAPARDSLQNGKRTLEDIHIEGEIPVPQVLFVTARDQRRLTRFHHRHYLKSGLEVGQETPFPSRIALTRKSSAPPTNPR